VNVEINLRCGKENITENYVRRLRIWGDIKRKSWKVSEMIKSKMVDYFLYIIRYHIYAASYI